jgi:hypothetical protein
MKTGSMIATALAFALSSLLGSLFAALAIVAVHGLLVLVVPRAQLVVFSGAVRSVMIGALVLSLPLIGRLPATEGAFASNAWWLAWAPPVWFVGLERWLIGDASRAALAAEAVIGTVIASILAVASYVVLYRRFDRVTVQWSPSQNMADGNRLLARWSGRVAVRHAIGRFVAITIRRSVLHQTLVVGALAVAGAWVLNGLLSVDAWHEPFVRRQRETLLWTLLGAPVTMMFLAVPAIRLALSVPLDIRSNWVFRMTEDVAGRAEVVAANVRVVFALGVALPIALIAPVQWWVLGPSTLTIVTLQALIGWLLVEWLMADWRRIPFTCSYVPGKGFVPHMVVKGFASYVLFTFITSIFLRISLAIPLTAVVLALGFGAAAAALSVQRSRHARGTSLTFEDELPTDVTQLRLSAD